MIQETQTFNLWHVLWTAVLSLIALLLKWNLHQLSAHIDQKADKAEVGGLKDSLDELRRNRLERDKRSDDMHAENRARLDRIYERLGGKA